MTRLVLTTLHLDMSHPLVRQELPDVCRMHARIMDMTAGMPDGPRVLWAQPAADTIVVRATYYPEVWAQLEAAGVIA